MRVVAPVMTAVAVSLLVAHVTGLLPRSIGRRRRSQRVSRTALALQRAGVTVGVSRFHAACLAVGLCAFGGVWTLSGIGMVALAPGTFASFVPRWWLARKAAQRTDAVQRAWPDALRDVLASVGSGASLQHALEGLGETGPEALREVFSRFAVAARVGGFEPALEAVRDSLADPTTDRIVEILLVAHEKGGSIVPEMLRDLASATSKDLWMIEQIHTESLEHRINARAVFALPWLVLIAITLQDGPFRDFYRSSAGFVVIAVGGVASVVGMALVRRLGASPDEPRVLDGFR